jgi:SAM-dependent methyltransferase
MPGLFPEDSPFLRADTRQTRWAIPYHRECLNARTEVLLAENKAALAGKSVLDIGSHIGTFAYSALQLGAEKVHGIDTETETTTKCIGLFEETKVDPARYQFETRDAIEYLESVEENSFDTALCLGVLYYVAEPLTLLRLLKRATRETILLDTFTASYAAVQGKEAPNIADSITDSTFEIPMALYALTRARKKDYELQNTFQHRGKPLSLTTYPTQALLELWFESLDFQYRKMDWSRYIQQTRHYRDFISPDQKRASHWADIYASNIRVAYHLKIQK